MHKIKPLKEENNETSFHTGFQHFPARNLPIERNFLVLAINIFCKTKAKFGIIEEIDGQLDHY